MHTDEQFADTLSQSMRASTANLHYAGPVPTPSQPLRVAAPIAAAAAAVGLSLAVAASVGSSGGSPATSNTSPRHTTAAAAGPTHQLTPMPAAQLISKTLRVAGMTLRYTQLSDATALYAQQADSVPSGAQQVNNDWSVKTYLGVQPGTGYQAAFVVTANGQILAITSPDATRSELLAAVQAPVSAVPSVSG